MPKTRDEKAVELADLLFQAESELEGAIQASAALFAELPRLRAQMRLSHTTGQAVFEAAARVNTVLVQARGAQATLHADLEDARVTLRLQPVTAGPGLDKPPYDTPRPASATFSHAPASRAA